MANSSCTTQFMRKSCLLIPRLTHQQNVFVAAQYVQRMPTHFCKGIQNKYFSSSIPIHQKDKLYKQITVEVKGHDLEVINSYQKFTTMAAEHLGVKISKISTPPRVITRQSLLKSVFVHKKHQHQYETRTNYREFEFKHLTESTALTFLEYIQRSLPEGLAMKVTKHELQPIPEHLKPPMKSKSSTPSSS